MFFVFLWEVVKRAFTPAPRVTDMLQILAASALPAASKFAGYPIPANAGDDALAYIGLIAVTFIAIRLFWAPYDLWKESNATIGSLRLELSKPERMVMEHLAKRRAKARAKLASLVEDLQTCSYAEKYEGFALERVAELGTKIRGLEAEAGVADAFIFGRRSLMVAIKDEADTPNEQLADQESSRITKLLQRYLVGDITAEYLALQLQPNIGERTQP